MVLISDNTTHILAIIASILILYFAYIRKSIVYGLLGSIWLFTHIFIYKYFYLFNKKSYIFASLFMLIPVLMAIILLCESYKYNDVVIKFIALAIILIDMYHLYLANSKLFIIFVIILILIRFFRESHYDDIHQNIPINYNYLNKSDILFVIPKYNNVSILNDPEFIRKIKLYVKNNNKKLGLHGFIHKPEGYITKAEFGYEVDESYIKDSINIFEEAFGYKPVYFKAPCYNLHPNNYKLLKKYNLIIYGPYTLLFNKLFHYDYDIVMTIFNKINLLF